MSNQREFESYCQVYAGRFSSGEAYVVKQGFLFDSGMNESRRGSIEGSASKACLRRLRRYLQNCNANYQVMVTLTYPDVFPSVVESKQHLNNFLQALYRDDGVKSVLWVMEFQQRGAVHYHLLIDKQFITHERIALMWFAATKGASNVLAGTRTERIVEKSGLSGYLSKYLSKNYQKIAAKGMQTGRYWGVRGDNSVKPMEAVKLVAERNAADLLFENAQKTLEALRFDNGVWFKTLDRLVFFESLSKLGGFVIYQDDKRIIPTTFAGEWMPDDVLGTYSRDKTAALVDENDRISAESVL